MSRLSHSASYLKVHWARAAVCAGLFVVFFGNQGFRSLVGNWIELRRLRREIVSLQKEETRLGERLQALRGGDAALERMARKELGYIKKGEVEYRFTPPSRRD